MGHDELLDRILRELTIIKNGIPNQDLNQVSDKINSIKQDLSELRILLMNPEDGVIVKVNKNTEYREGRQGNERVEFENIQEIKELIGWKETVTRALWIIFTALIGIGVKIIFFNG